MASLKRKPEDDDGGEEDCVAKVQRSDTEVVDYEAEAAAVESKEGEASEEDQEGEGECDESEEESEEEVYPDTTDESAGPKTSLSTLVSDKTPMFIFNMTSVDDGKDISDYAPLFFVVSANQLVKEEQDLVCEFNAASDTILGQESHASSRELNQRMANLISTIEWASRAKCRVVSRSASMAQKPIEKKFNASVRRLFSTCHKIQVPQLAGLNIVGGMAMIDARGI